LAISAAGQNQQLDSVISSFAGYTAAEKTKNLSQTLAARQFASQELCQYINNQLGSLQQLDSC
jgi:hypothetical protein